MNTVKTILFVENDPVALEMYRNRLLREGFHVESAQDGLEALKILAQLIPDLIVLDMMLPKLSGADVLKFVRTDGRLKTIPVVIFSNAPMSESSSEIALAGPTKRLLKSDCTFPMLLQTIQELLIAASTMGSTGGSFAAPSPASNRFPDVSFVARNEASKGSTEFLSEALAEIPKIREHCFAYIKSPASPAGLQHLPNLYQRVHFLSTNAGKAGCARVALLANAFDTLLSEIMVKPSWVTPSVLQTIAQAVDCLGFLLKSNAADLAQPMPQARVLAVDDDAVCNHVIVNTLKRANFDAKSVDDPLVALQILQSTQFDLVLLDINMPDLTGFEVCEKLRRFPHCKTTPVIFITGHNNFDNRKQSVLSGGHDFITKPVSPSELALKATIHLLKVRVQRGVSQPGTDAGAGSPPPDAADAANLFRRIAPNAGAPQSSLPASVLLPTTESRTGDVPVPPYPVSPAPTAQPAPAPVPEEMFQPANSIQILQPGAKRVENIPPSTVFRPAAESRNSDPQNRTTPNVNLPPEETSSIRISGGMFPSLNPTPAGRPEMRQTEEAGASSVFLPSVEPGVSNLEAGLFSSDAAPVPGAASPEIPEEVLQHFAPQLESDLRGELEAAKAAASQSEAVLQEKETGWRQMEAELAGLRQIRDEFQGKLAVELETATKSQQEIRDLQERLNRSTADLEQARAGADRQSSERARIESDLRSQLEAARSVASQSEAALKEKEAGWSRMEAELAELRQTRDEFQGKLATEQESGAKTQQEIKELQEQLNRSAEELEQAKAGVDRQSMERTRIESDLRGQLEAAKAAVSQSEAALKEKEMSRSRLEAELAGLRQTRDEFQGKLATEQESAAKARQEIKELQERLNRSAEELEQARAGVDRQSMELTRIESDLRGQLETARAATGRSEAALREKEAGWNRMEAELAELRQTREEFQGKLATEQESAAKAQQEIKELQEQLNRRTAELEQAKTGVDQQSSERTRIESDLRTQLEAAKTAAGQSETALKDKEADWTRLEADLREQLDTAKTAAGQTATFLKEKDAWCNEVEEELARLQQARDEFQVKLTTEQDAGVKAQQEIRELRDKLNRSATELEQAKAGVGLQSAEQTKLESNLREQLEAAKATSSQMETELTGLRQARDEFQGKLTTEQESAAKAQQEIKELQERLNRSTTELEQAKAGVDQQSSERARIESDLRGQLESAKTTSSQMETELTGLRQARDEFQGKLTAEQESAAKAQQEIKELQEQLNRRTAELEQAKAGVDQQSSERTRIESDLRAQLEAARSVASQSEAAVKEKEAGWSQMETELTGLRQARDEFQGKLTTEQESAAKAQQEIKELQEQLNRRTAELEQAKAGVDQQSSERARIESDLRGQLESAKATSSQMETELTGLRQARDEFQGKLTTEQESAAKAQQEIKELQERLNRSTTELEQAKAGAEHAAGEWTRFESQYQNLAKEKDALDLELGRLREAQSAWETDVRNKQKKIAEALQENVELLQESLKDEGKSRGN